MHARFSASSHAVGKPVEIFIIQPYVTGLAALRIWPATVSSRSNAFHPLIAVFQCTPETDFRGVMHVAHLSSAIEPRLINPSHGILG